MLDTKTYGLTDVKATLLLLLSHFAAFVLLICIAFQGLFPSYGHSVIVKFNVSPQQGCSVHISSAFYLRCLEGHPCANSPDLTQVLLLRFLDNSAVVRDGKKGMWTGAAATWCQVAAVLGQVTHHGHGQPRRLCRGRARRTLSVFRRRERGGASPGRRERCPRFPAAPSELPHVLPAAAPLALLFCYETSSGKHLHLVAFLLLFGANLCNNILALQGGGW